MTEVLGQVISSTGLGDSNAAASTVCPRQYLGLACVADQFSCICSQVATCEVATVENRGGQTSVLTLSMTLMPGADPHTVMAGIDLTGFKADYVASRSTVAASFNLARSPQNAALRTLMRDTGI